MGTVSTNEFRKKLKIMVDGQPYEIIENQFVKPGKGQAFNRVRIKNLVTGRTLERTWKSGDTVEEAEVTYTEMTYLYNDGGSSHNIVLTMVHICHNIRALDGCFIDCLRLDDFREAAQILRPRVEHERSSMHCS